MLFLTEDNVRKLLPMEKAVALVRSGFERLNRGDAINQPRRRLVLPTRSVLHQMAASSGPYFGTKIYSTHPVHGAHFLFMLYDSETARPLLLAEANALGQIRTGAASGVATDWLAPKDVESVALLGCGFQGETQLDAVMTVRPSANIRLWNRTPEKAEKLAKTVKKKYSGSVKVCRSAEEAVREAQVVITATSAKDPVFEDGWLGPRVHVNAIGSNQPARREVPGETVLRASLIAVDDRAQAEVESGDLLLAVPVEEWETLPLVEMKDLTFSRTFPVEGVTLFKSNGLALEDVMVGGYLYEQAVEQEIGRKADLFGG